MAARKPTIEELRSRFQNAYLQSEKCLLCQDYVALNNVYTHTKGCLRDYEIVNSDALTPLPTIKKRATETIEIDDEAPSPLAKKSKGKKGKKTEVQHQQLHNDH
jgi:hypothetical protein